MGTPWVDCRDMKSGGEVNDQLTVREVLGRITYDDTIYSLRGLTGREMPIGAMSAQLKVGNLARLSGMSGLPSTADVVGPPRYVRQPITK